MIGLEKQIEHQEKTIAEFLEKFEDVSDIKGGDSIRLHEMREYLRLLRKFPKAIDIIKRVAQ